MSRSLIDNDVRALRSARGWTQQDLADRVGVSRQSIISIEQGRYIPSLPLALQLARAFACPVEQVFRMKEER